MSDDEIPDNEWDTEIRRRTLEGEDELAARAEVIARYLDVCDPRPLVSAIIKGRALSADTMRCVAAHFGDDPSRLLNESVPTIFGISFGNGRPPKTLSASNSKIMALLMCGAAMLREGQDPGGRFWKLLAYGLRCGHLEHWIGSPPESPLRIRLQFRELDHRPPAPWLGERNRVLRWLVDNAVHEGLNKDAAFERVAKDCQLGSRTVKRAYYRE